MYPHYNHYGGHSPREERGSYGQIGEYPAKRHHQHDNEFKAQQRPGGRGMQRDLSNSKIGKGSHYAPRTSSAQRYGNMPSFNVSGITYEEERMSRMSMISGNSGPGGPRQVNYQGANGANERFYDRKRSVSSNSYGEQLPPPRGRSDSRPRSFN